MKKIFLPIVALVAMTIATSCSQSSTPQANSDDSNDKAQISAVVDQYISTINNDDTTLVNRIWSHGDEVSFIGPSGRYSTYNEIRDSLVHGLFGLNFTERNLRKESLDINVYGDMAWLEFTWAFDAVRKDGGQHRARGRETQILHREDGQWKLVHIHYSALR